ncbi:DNA repair protein XRCC4 [Halyomorpha halys]|uniref:DNA repair protein XRCC4 n=1 Tax=Halyomorpha halys TaxID=286706 RepID=UPI0006D50960|nr:DNA repair protein XRCC4-like [Halyomorpha halys]
MDSFTDDFTKEFESLDIITPDNLKLRLQTHWRVKESEINSLNILLVCNNAVWKGSINRWMLEEKAHDLNLQCNDYCDSLKYVFGSPWGPKNDILNFNDGVLSWQKILKSGAFISFGDFSLNMIEDSGLLADIISSLVDSYHLWREKFEVLSEKNSDIQKGWDDLKQYTEKMIQSKNQMETNLYVKFAAILNEKKSKINDLRNRAD